MLPEALFDFFCFTAVPEAPGRVPEALPEACLKLIFYLGPGRVPEGFRKGSGRVAGRVPEALPEACLKLSFYLGPGRVPEGFRKSCRKGLEALILELGPCK